MGKNVHITHDKDNKRWNVKMRVRVLRRARTARKAPRSTRAAIAQKITNQNSSFTIATTRSGTKTATATTRIHPETKSTKGKEIEMAEQPNKEKEKEKPPKPPHPPGPPEPPKPPHPRPVG